MKFRFCKSCCFSSKSTSTTVQKNISDDETNQGSLRIFTYNQLQLATRNFSASDKIGEGGFGSVFKGRLDDGSLVAIKVLSIEMESMRGEREFISELAALSDIKHENLVKLQGCCVDGGNRYLVYDYMENNSLAHTLSGKEENRKRFGWESRRDISLGVARGIAYLHEELHPHILHRDIKASNILLDENFVPKVADFGLSRLLRGNDSYVSTRVAGTLGYLAPEYAVTGRLSRKSDVYSYGVLLMEIISGRTAVDFDLEHGEHYLVEKAWEAYRGDKLLDIVDPTLNKKFPEEEAIRFLTISLLCVQETANLRPKMSTIIKMLNKETEMQDVQISPPGLLSDLTNIRLRQTTSSEITSSSMSSTTANLSSSTTHS